MCPRQGPFLPTGRYRYLNLLRGPDPALAPLGLPRSIITLEGMNSSHFFCQGPHSLPGERDKGKEWRIAPFIWVLRA